MDQIFMFGVNRTSLKHFLFYFSTTKIFYQIFFSTRKKNNGRLNDRPQAVLPDLLLLKVCVGCYDNLMKNKQYFWNEKMRRMVIYCIFVFAVISGGGAYEVIDNLSLANCNQSSYFNSLAHKCQTCSPFQTASDDRLSCRCETGYHPEFSDKSKAVECAKCDDASRSAYCKVENLTCGVYDIKGMKWILPFMTRINCTLLNNNSIPTQYCKWLETIPRLNVSRVLCGFNRTADALCASLVPTRVTVPQSTKMSMEPAWRAPMSYPSPRHSTRSTIKEDSTRQITWVIGFDQRRPSAKYFHSF